MDTATFRATLARLATGITVVTTRDHHGVDHGMTVSAFSSLSLDPPLVLVCIDEAATVAEPLAVADHFGVSILGAEQESVSRRFATQDTDRFDGIAVTRTPSGLALIDGALAQLECAIVARYPGGDHTIVVGEVLSAQSRDGAPLLYFRGGYRHLAP
jgi:flavin reductase (DIM6/NTAB) family NADH-FMN oxidoreductase RutF